MDRSISDLQVWTCQNDWFVVLTVDLSASDTSMTVSFPWDQTRFLGMYVGLGITETLVHSVQVGYGHAVWKNIRNLQKLAEYGRGLIRQVLLTRANWTPLPLSHMLSNLVTLLSTRTFVGYPLNRNKTWVRTDPCQIHLLIHGEVPRSFSPHLVILWMALQVNLRVVFSKILQ